MGKICALIAAFNEEAHIARVVQGTMAFVDAVVVVDDGSTDLTAVVARLAGGTVISHTKNRGKGHAVRTGLDYVLRQEYSHVLFLDGDFQHDPTEIPSLIERARVGSVDLVIGEREFRKDAMPAARYYANVIGSGILSWFVGAKVRDSQSGFRLIRAELLRRIPLTASRYEIETEIIIKAMRAGAILDTVVVRRLEYRDSHSKIRPFRDTFRTCMLALRYRFWPNYGLTQGPR
jgi:glycosyltransferase involved in cell wall biosynthesis